MRRVPLYGYSIWGTTGSGSVALARGIPTLADAAEHARAIARERVDGLEAIRVRDDHRGLEWAVGPDGLISRSARSWTQSGTWPVLRVGARDRRR